MSFLQKLKIKKLSLLSLFLGIAGVFAFNLKFAQAWEWPSLPTPGSLINSAVAGLGYLMVKMVGWVFGLAGWVFEWTLSITRFSQAEVVKMGWSITRDMANLTLILIVLVIAIATILRLESWGMKQLLPRLIIVALLINFSLVFCGIAIDFSQVAATFFTDRISGSLTGQMANSMGIQNTLNGTASITASKGASEIFSYIAISLLGSIVIIAGGVIAFGLAAAILIFRILALWILMILCPLALLASILPLTKSYWNQWVMSFLKWLIFAPVFAFFVYLATYTSIHVIADPITNSIQSNSSIDVSASMAPGALEGGMSTFFAIESILSYFVILGLLFGGLIVAQKAGLYGANGAIRIATNIGKGTASWAGGGIGRWATGGMRVPLVGAASRRMAQSWVGRKTGMDKLVAPVTKMADTKRKVVGAAAAAFTPTFWHQLAARRRSRAEGNQSISESAGRLNDAVVSAQEWLKHPKDASKRERSYYATQARDKEVNKIQEQYKGMFPESQQMAQQARAAKTTAEKEAAIRNLAASDDLEDLLGANHNPEGLKKHLVEEFGEDRAAIIYNDVASMLKSNGDLRFRGGTKWDEKEGKYAFESDIKGATEKKMASDWRKKNPEDAWKGIRSKTITEDYKTKDASGNEVTKKRLTSHAQSLFRTMGEAGEVYGKNASYAQGYVIEAVQDTIDEIKTINPKFVEGFEKAVAKKTGASSNTTNSTTYADGAGI